MGRGFLEWVAYRWVKEGVLREGYPKCRELSMFRLGGIKNVVSYDSEVMGEVETEGYR